MATSERYIGEPGSTSLRQVRGYELLDEIEAGGMAHVYRARRLADGAIVAIKMIHIDNMAADYEARLRREPEVQQGIGHDNIVRLEESFREHDEFFLVIEYVDGRSLARMIHTETGPLPFERARGYFRQVLRAVDHLHRVGIVHRDIKPSNILVRWDDAVKLADFGIAKFIWQEGGTATRQGLGTPQYMSPEQVSGDALDHRTDIYSLGATFFEMLTGRMPYSRDAATPMAYMQVIQDVLAVPLPDPRTYQPMVPVGAVRLIEKATAKDQADRFQSAAEFAAALDAISDEIISPPTIAAGAFAAAAPVAAAPAPADPTMVPGASAPPGAPPLVRHEPVRSEPIAPPVPVNRTVRRRWKLDRTTMLIALAFVAALGIAAYLAVRPSDTALVAGEFGPGDAPRINTLVKGIAARYERGMAGCTGDSVAALYAARGVRYFTLGAIDRPAIASEIAAFCAGTRSVDHFDVRVDSVWLVKGAIESQWSVRSQRTLRGDTLYRDTATDMLRLEPRDGGWVIVEQRHLQSKHYTVVPPAKPRPSTTRQRPRASRSASPVRSDPVPAVERMPVIPKSILNRLEKIGQPKGDGGKKDKPEKKNKAQKKEK